MHTYAPRTKTPLEPEDDTDAEAVEPSLTRDVTEPELAPPMRPTPVAGIPVPARAVRSRKATLVSPIPALLAASMSEIREDKGSPTPVPIAVRGEETSRFNASDQAALLMDDESDFMSDYIVEVVHTPKKP